MAIVEIGGGRGERQGKNKNLAALLALFGGSFGLHKFYLGDPGGGIFYIILSAMTRGFIPIATILGVIDAIRLFSMSTQKFDAKYNKGKRRQQTRSEERRRAAQAPRANRDVVRERSRMNNRQITSKQRNNPFRKSADKKFAEYDLEGALEDYDKATEITPADKDMHFNLACIYSLKEDKDQSIHHLEEAINMGFKDTEKISSIDELAYLRIQPEFDAFVANGYKKTSRQKSVTPPKKDLLQNDALLAQLNKLKEMRDRGLLSEKEFSYEKERLTRRR